MVDEISRRQDVLEHRSLQRSGAQQKDRGHDVLRKSRRQSDSRSTSAGAWTLARQDHSDYRVQRGEWTHEGRCDRGWHSSVRESASKIAWTQQFDKIQTLVESPAPSTGWAKDVALGSKYNGSATHKDRLKRGDHPDNVVDNLGHTVAVRDQSRRRGRRRALRTQNCAL